MFDLTHPISKRVTFPGDTDEQPTSDEKHLPVRTAIAQSASPAIILSIPITVEGPDGSMVLDVTQIFANEIADFSPMANLNNSQVAVIA